MRRALLLPLGLAFLLGCAGNPLLTGGKIQITLEEYDRAIELFTQNVEKNPDDPEGYLWLGIAYGRKRDYGAGSESFDKAVQLDPLYLDNMRAAKPDQYWGGAASYWVTYVNAGIDLMKERSYEAAKEKFLTAAEVQPDSAPTYNYLGYVHSQLGDDGEACKAYAKAVKLGPRNVEAHLNMAACHLKKEEYDEALALLTKAVEMDSSSDRALYLKGICHFQREQYQKAEDSFRKAANLNAKNKDAWYNLGIVLLRTDKAAEAAQILEKTIELAPGDEDAWYQLGTAYFKLEDYEKADTAFTKVIEINPTNADAYENRAYARKNLGLKQKAYEDLETADRLRKQQGG